MHPPPEIAQINHRFRYGHPSVHLSEVGVMIHQLNVYGYQETSVPWRVLDGRGTYARDRISTSIIYHDMHERADRVHIPIFSLGAGLIFRPEASRLLCSYIDDGGTQHANCASSERPTRERRLVNRLQRSEPSCIPGCTHAAGFCDRDAPTNEGGWCYCGRDWCNGRPQPWGPNDLDRMLDLFQTKGRPYKVGGGQSSGYNELILDGRHWERSMPAAVEAVFYVRAAHTLTKEVAAEVAAAKSFASKVHRDFLAYYQLSPSEFPLLELREGDWSEPFHLAH